MSPSRSQSGPLNGRISTPSGGGMSTNPERSASTTKRRTYPPTRSKVRRRISSRTATPPPARQARTASSGKVRMSWTNWASIIRRTASPPWLRTKAHSPQRQLGLGKQFGGLVRGAAKCDHTAPAILEASRSIWHQPILAPRSEQEVIKVVLQVGKSPNPRSDTAGNEGGRYAEPLG